MRCSRRPTSCRAVQATGGGVQGLCAIGRSAARGQLSGGHGVRPIRRSQILLQAPIYTSSCVVRALRLSNTDQLELDIWPLSM